jgi:AraC-like DNA-binding protein
MHRAIAKQAQIRELDFDNPLRPDFPIEVLSLAGLARKAPPGALSRPLRPSFHQLVIPTRGRIGHEVDFQRLGLAPGNLSWAHPGQVQRLDLRAGADGWLLLFTGDLLDGPSFGVGFEPAATSITLGSAAGDAMWLLERVRRQSVDVKSEASRPLARYLLHALLVLIQVCARSSAPQVTSDRNVFSLFRVQVERRFAKTRRLTDYQRFVGYSSKTLNRATQRATGLGAKRYIDQRVLLEARRLLAHTSLPVGAIATDLGLSELTNFVKFFRRESGGESPSAFRARTRR